MQISCAVCALTAEVTLGANGYEYAIALPPCFSLRCPQLAPRLMEEHSLRCDECQFMARAAERAFARFMKRQ